MDWQDVVARRNEASNTTSTRWRKTGRLRPIVGKSSVGLAMKVQLLNYSRSVLPRSLASLFLEARGSATGRVKALLVGEMTSTIAITHWQSIAAVDAACHRIVAVTIAVQHFRSEFGCAGWIDGKGGVLAMDAGRRRIGTAGVLKGLALRGFKGIEPSPTAPPGFLPAEVRCCPWS